MKVVVDRILRKTEKVRKNGQIVIHYRVLSGDDVIDLWDYTGEGNIEEGRAIYVYVRVGKDGKVRYAYLPQVDVEVE